MKINNETKVGILAVFALTAMILGFNFLKGKGVWSRSPKLYAEFSDLSGLDKSNEVKINGLTVGTVYDLTNKDKEVKSIIVTINLNRDVEIPRDSRAYIQSSLVGSSSIVIEMGKSNQFLANGDTVSTRVDEGLLGDLGSQVTPTLSKARDAIDSLKILMGTVNSALNPRTVANLQQVIANLVVASSNLQQLLNTQSGALAGTLNNLSAVTGNLKENNDTIAGILRNVNQTTSNLSQLNFQQTLDKLDSTMLSLKDAVNKINSPTGSLGKLINDEALYNNLNYTVVSMETLLDDIRAHPKRYVNISVFGKKDKDAPLSSPLEKDTIYRK